MTADTLIQEGRQELDDAKEIRHEVAQSIPSAKALADRTRKWIRTMGEAWLDAVSVRHLSEPDCRRDENPMLQRNRSDGGSLGMAAAMAPERLEAVLLEKIEAQTEGRKRLSAAERKKQLARAEELRESGWRKIAQGHRLLEAAGADPVVERDMPPEIFLDDGRGGIDLDRFRDLVARSEGYNAGARDAGQEFGELRGDLRQAKDSLKRHQQHEPWVNEADATGGHAAAFQRVRELEGRCERVRKRGEQIQARSGPAGQLRSACEKFLRARGLPVDDPAATHVKLAG